MRDILYWHLWGNLRQGATIKIKKKKDTRLSRSIFGIARNINWNGLLESMDKSKFANRDRENKKHRHKVTRSYCFGFKGNKSVFHKGATCAHIIISVGSILSLPCHTPFLLRVGACPCLTVSISPEPELYLLYLWIYKA